MDHDDTGSKKRKDFNINQTIDLKYFLNPLKTELADTKYQIFGFLAMNAHQIDENLILINKRLKKQKKNQWYIFSDGKYELITQDQALKDYYPLMIVYKRITP